MSKSYFLKKNQISTVCAIYEPIFVNAPANRFNTKLVQIIVTHSQSLCFSYIYVKQSISIKQGFLGIVGSI